MIGKHFFVVGVLSCVFVSGPASAEEIIEVTSCDPFEAEVGSGAEMVCVGMEDWLSDTGQPEDDPFDGPEGDEYSKGPKKKTKTKTKKSGGGGNPNPGKEEAQRKARCKACKTASSQCKQGAQAEELRCETNARGTAAWRCNINKQQGPGKTPWGCNTNQLYEGLCNTAEPPWNDRDKWEPGGENTQYYCEQSWAVSHPNGSISSEEKLDLSVLFKGVGASSSTTVKSTYELQGKNGWQNSCTAAGDALQDGCDDAATKCFDENDCSAAERK